MSSSSSSSSTGGDLLTSLSSSSSFLNSSDCYNFTQFLNSTNTTLINSTLTYLNCTPSSSSSSTADLLPYSSSSSSSPYNLSSSTAPYIQASSPSDGLFSVDAVFLTSVLQIWFQITIWTMVGTAFVFFFAGAHAVRVNSDHHTPSLYYVVVPLTCGMFGGGVGFVQGSITAALIGAVAVSINTSVGIDIAAGLGLGQAIIITYFHLGRADFIHR
jgi:hypothetical protein